MKLTDGPLPYTFGRNGEFIGPSVEQMWANKGFQKQIAAAVKLGKLMNLEKQRNQEIYRAGYRAGADATPASECPHQAEGRRERWLSGWREARKDEELLFGPHKTVFGDQK